MKKALTVIVCLSFILNSIAQDASKETEHNNRLQFHSISLTPLSLYFSEEGGGLVSTIDVGFNSGKHIFKVCAGGGTEFKLNLGGESPKDSFQEYNILYGRALPIKKWFAIDFFAGVGYFNFKYSGTYATNYVAYKKGVIGFPLQSKIRFNITKTFSSGLQLHSNINSATTIYQPGIFFQFNL